MTPFHLGGFRPVAKRLAQIDERHMLPRMLRILACAPKERIAFEFWMDRLHRVLRGLSSGASQTEISMPSITANVSGRLRTNVAALSRVGQHRDPATQCLPRGPDDIHTDATPG